MKKNLYYRNVFRRHNIIKEALLDFFYTFCSGPRLLLEVFIKRNFGERYFSYSTAVLMTVFLCLATLPLYDVAIFFYGFSHSFWDIFFIHFLSWYIFLAAFLYVCRKHRKDIKRSPSVFDFARFSLSTGQLTPVFEKLLRHLNHDIRDREIILEPALFFLAGLILMILGQWVGLLLMFSSVFYGFGWWGAYHKADNFVMDKIDEMIMNEQMVDAFVHGLSPDKTKGVQFMNRRPNSEDLRRKVADSFVEKEGGEDVAFVK